MKIGSKKKKQELETLFDEPKITAYLTAQIIIYVSHVKPMRRDKMLKVIEKNVGMQKSGRSKPRMDKYSGNRYLKCERNKIYTDVLW